MPKPDRLLYEANIRPLMPGISPSRTLVIGDTEMDLQFAGNIGAHSCWASYGYGDRARSAALQPDFTISEISELLGICEPVTSETR